MTEELLEQAADAAYAAFYPNTDPVVTGKERAWRGEPAKNPLLRPLRKALESLGVWCVEGSFGLWVVRAESEEEAIEVAYCGPGELGEASASEYGLKREELTACRVEPGPAAIIGSHFG